MRRGQSLLGLIGILALVFMLLAGLSVLGVTCGLIHETLEVAHDELGPHALLKKYEWFKDAAAELDKRRADITVYNQRLKNLEGIYGKPSTWPRDVREQSLVWAQEVAGIRAAYNSLAAQYNSQMAKINYRFTNIGMLPEGATEPLPREYRTYEEN